MTTYLLSWNPRRFSWDELQERIEEINENGFCLSSWSVGASKRVRRGDRLFLIRLGKEPRGIVGSGWAESNVYEDRHWEAGRRKNKEGARYVQVRFDSLLNPDNEGVLPREELPRLGNMHWDIQGSGIRIPDDIASKLEDAWADFVAAERAAQVVCAEPSAIEGLRTEIVAYTRGRSRLLRDLALKQADGICCACDVDFKRLLSGKGVRVLQVHHRKQLAASDAPRVTHLSNLAVVCANCHALIHMNPQRSISTEKLRMMLGKSPKA